MTTDLDIDRLEVTVRGGGSRAREIAAGLARVAGSALEAATSPISDLSTGLWCIRRLDVVVGLEPGEADAVLGRAWADAVVAAIRQAAIRSDRADAVVHYCDRRDALIDLVAELAAGRRDRAWAWRRLDLVGVEPNDDPLPVLLEALGRRPDDAVPAVVAATARVGIEVLDRVLGSQGWAAIADIASSSSASGGTGEPAAAARRADGLISPDPAARRSSPAAQARAVVAASGFAAQVGRSRVRATRSTLLSWAALVVREVAPSRTGYRGRDAIAAVADELTFLTAAPARPGLPPAPSPGAPDPAPPHDEPPVLPIAAPGTAVDPDGQPEPAPDLPAPVTAAPSDGRRRSVDTPGGSSDDGPSTLDPLGTVSGRRSEPTEELPEDRSGEPTAWAGLAFLLATAADAGLPERAVTAEALETKPLPWVMHWLGRVIAPIAADDPALLVLAGLDRVSAEAVLDAAPATEGERRALDELARRWIAVTAERLAEAGAAADDARAQVNAVAARPGRVVAEPSWTDVVMSLSSVDLVVRRAGLDLDPGWVPWLGTVVRYVYE